MVFLSDVTQILHLFETMKQTYGEVKLEIRLSFALLLQTHQSWKAATFTLKESCVQTTDTEQSTKAK